MHAYAHPGFDGARSRASTFRDRVARSALLVLLAIFGALLIMSLQVRAVSSRLNSELDNTVVPGALRGLNGHRVNRPKVR